MKRLATLIIIPVILLNIYSIVELTRCIFLYNHMDFDTIIELVVMWGGFIFTPIYIYSVLAILRIKGVNHA